MNKFYSYPKWLQWSIAICMTGIAVCIIGLWLEAISEHRLYYLLFLVFIPLLQLTMTPILRLTGVYAYLSPMLLVYAPTEKKYDLHNGTSFDYWFVMRGVPAGRVFRQQMLFYYLEGLLELIRKLESGDLPLTVEITGTSYFFSESTARRLGFSMEKPSWFYRLNLYFNYLDLIWMYSLAKGRLTFPNLNETKAVSTTGEQLLQQKEYLNQLYQRLRPAVNKFAEKTT